MITKPDYYENAGEHVLSERLSMLNALNVDDPHIQIVEQTPYTDSNFETMKEKSQKGGWEGLILRFNAKFEGKRTDRILKYKNMYSEEFVVQDLEIKEMPFPNDTGGEDFLPALNSIVIHYKDHPVWVGSGFTKDERLDYYKNPDKIRGKTVIVKFQEPIEDKKNGKWSLRFPIFVALLSKVRDF